jgi:HSP20 family molecular chaperone IbpA
MYPLLILMNDWIGYVEDWFNQSSMVFADDEFDRMKKELVNGFDNLMEEFDRIFSNDSEEFRFSESYSRVRSTIAREEVDVITSPLSGPLHGIEKLDRDSSEDVIVTDKNIKVVLQLPINNKRENIKVVAHSDNSMTISHLNSEGKLCTRTSVVPYDIDFETAKATYKNGILEIIFKRK